MCSSIAHTMSHRKMKFIFIKCRMIYMFCVKNISQMIDSPSLLWHMYLTLHWVCHFFCTHTYIEVVVDVLKDKGVKAKKNLIFHIKNPHHGGNCHNKLNKLIFLWFPSLTKIYSFNKKFGTSMRYQLFVEVLILECWAISHPALRMRYKSQFPFQ